MSIQKRGQNQRSTIGEFISPENGFR